jgi:hypothetical protein
METRMQLKWMLATFATLGIAASSGTYAYAQADIAASFYQAITSASSGHGTQQTPANGTGGMIEARDIFKPLLGFELTYSLNQADQTLAPKAGSCGFTCDNQPTTVSAYAHEITGDWIVSEKRGSLRPFGLVGIGFFITQPTSNQYDLNTIVKPVYVFGGGTDWALSQRFGLRFQFRENLYKAPEVSGLFNPTGAFTQSAEPMAGFYFRP